MKKIKAGRQPNRSRAGDISQMADHYIKDPNEVVRLNQRVRVKVLDVDIDRKRISLSMRN